MSKVEFVFGEIKPPVNPPVRIYADVDKDGDYAIYACRGRAQEAVMLAFVYSGDGCLQFVNYDANDPKAKLLTKWGVPTTPTPGNQVIWRSE